MEELGGEELTALGASEVKPVFRGLHFKADPAALYRINYCSRLCTRVLAPLLSFDCHSTKYLHRTARELPWERLLTPEMTFAVTATVSNSHIRHSHYASLCLKDAVVDRLRDLHGRRPNVDREHPDCRLNLHIENNQAVISLDTGSGSLHRRGYRRQSVEAPMQETVAAAVIRLCGWDGSLPLLDPLCGSGTLLAEALMEYCRIPAGFLRSRFGFELLADFAPEVWQQVKRETDSRIRPLPAGLVAGSDISPEAVAAARANLGVLPGGDRVKLQTQPFEKYEAVAGSMIICNPPYGIRLNHRQDMQLFFKQLGDFLKRRCTGSTACIYLGKRELVKMVGLRPAWKKPLQSGGLDGLLVKYELY